MKKRIVSAAAAIAVALAASGCGEDKLYGAEYPEKYAKFLDYTFNDEYSVTLKAQEQYEAFDSESGKNITSGYRRWVIDYSDRNGQHQQMELLSSLHVNEPKNDYERMIDDIKIYSQVVKERKDIASCELYKNYVSKYFDAGQWLDDGTFIYRNDYFTLQAMTYDLFPKTIDENNGLDKVKDTISAKKGYCLADCGLAGEVSDKNVFTFIRIYFYRMEDTEKRANDFDALVDEIMNHTGKVQNAHFELIYCNRTIDNGNFTKVAEKNYILGQETELQLPSSNTLDLEFYEDEVLERLGMERAEKKEEDTEGQQQTS